MRIISTGKVWMFEKPTDPSSVVNISKRLVDGFAEKSIGKSDICNEVK
jgi:hypothetical protein